MLAQYHFKLERTSWKSQYLIFEEPGFRLVVDLEMSGLEDFDWVGTDSGFEQWTSPPGEPISVEKRTEILDRLAAWSQGQGVRIKISPPKGLDQYFEEHRTEIENLGWKIEREGDGMTILDRPKSESLWNRIVNLFRL